MGGCDKQGFPMKQDTPCFRGYGRRDGERSRKSVRGCIVSQDLSVINLVIVKKGDNDLPGLTDTKKPRMRGPKRASKIRKFFNLAKDVDTHKYVNTYRRTFTTKNGKKVSEAPKIQRLVTPLTLQRKRARIAKKKQRITKKKSEAAEYQKLLAQRLKEQRERRSESLAKRRVDQQFNILHQVTNHENQQGCDVGGLQRLRGMAIWAVLPPCHPTAAQHAGRLVEVAATGVAAATSPQTRLVLTAFSLPKSHAFSLPEFQASRHPQS
ncbi:hypothetical protein ABZP36_012427 [Zizania latifolia]